MGSLQRHGYRLLLSAVFFGSCLGVSAVFADDTAPSRWIESVHEPIPVKNLDEAAVRRAILEGMWYTRGYSWQLERETDNSIVARFDYRRGSILFDIVYDTSSVQLKFLDGNNGYECDNLRDGICYDNGRSYYNYSKNLRASIAEQLKLGEKK